MQTDASENREHLKALTPDEVHIYLEIETRSITDLKQAHEAMDYLRQRLGMAGEEMAKMREEHAAAIKRALKTNEANEAHWRALLNTQTAISDKLQDTIVKIAGGC